MFGTDLTKKQSCILRTARRNPDMSDRQIASRCNCSASYVSETLRKHGSRGGFGLAFDGG